MSQVFFYQRMTGIEHPNHAGKEFCYLQRGKDGSQTVFQNYV